MDTLQKRSLVVAIIIAVLFIVSKFTGKSVGSTNFDKMTIRKYEDLLQQSIHLYELSKQDSDTVVALVHSTTSLGIVNALSKMITNSNAQKFLEVNLDQFSQEVSAYQKQIAQHLKQYVYT